MTDNHTIKVLFADDNDAKVDGVTRLLHFEDDIQVVGHVNSADQLMERYEELDPTVVLMDPELPPSNGFDATRALLKEEPLAQVILLSLENDPEGLRQAMRSGAADYVSNYVNGTRLAESVREAAVRRERLKKVTGQLPALPQAVQTPQGPKGKVIALFSPKGGTGVTTLAVNLALALHTEETPTALVDADLQFGDVCAFLNMQPRLTIVDMTTQAGSLDDELLRELLLAHDSGLKIAAAPLAPELADEVTASGLARVLEVLKNRYPYVVVDAGSYLNDVSLTVLETADLVLSVILPEIPSIKDARLLLDLFFKLELPREKLHFVMNQVDKRELIRMDRVSENLRHPVLGEIPYDRESVKDAINRGRPLISDQKTHPLMRSFLALVGEIKAKLVEAETAEREPAAA